ncbi:unnamed protein product [Rhizophagus irregularis]|nr:unnamed protein product [Rhizophagus irregularis]
MNSNNQNTQDYYNLPRNSSAPQQILNNINNENNQHTLINNVENVQLLNNGINRIPDYLLPHHYNVQSLIQQQIQQQVQHSIVYQQNNTQQQSFDTTQLLSQVYSDNDTYNTAANGTVSYDMQDMGDTGFQNSP